MLIARDERLARQAAAGDDRAFTLLYRRHHPALLRYCRSITGNEHDAFDALQSAALKALLALRRGGCSGQVRPWLFRIAHNESVSLLRRRGSSATVALQDDDVAVGDVADTAAEREAFGMLVADLHALTDHQRSALVLRELSGLEYGEIAVALDTSPLAARQAVFAARSALHESRAARDLTCVTVQRTLSDGASRRGVRMHLRGCDDCRSFAREIRRRSSRMGLLIPVSPLSAAVVLQTVLGSGAAVTAGTAGSVVAGGGAAFGGPSLAKAAAAALATVAAAGSVEQVVVERPKQERAQAQERAAVDVDDAPTARAAAAGEPAGVRLAVAPLSAATERAAATARERPAAEGDGDDARDDDATADRPDAQRREEDDDASRAADDDWDDDEPALEDADRGWSDTPGGGSGGRGGGWGRGGHGEHGGYGGRGDHQQPAVAPVRPQAPAPSHAQAARSRGPWRQQTEQAVVTQAPVADAPASAPTTTTPTTTPEPEPTTAPTAPVDASPAPTTTTPADPAPAEPAVADPA